MLTAYEISQICHEANRQLQQIQADPTNPVSEPWDSLDNETRLSAVEGVENIMNGAVRTPVESHDSWLKFKKDHGWSYGPIKDPATKQHPCFVPYEELPGEQQIKDALFFAIVGALK